MHPEIEKLIEFAIADGQLTEKERTVLFRKSKEMGIDEDELEMVLEAKLFEKRQSIKHAAATTITAPKTDKLGDLKKCPACGAIPKSFSTHCTDCGYEFRNTGANTTVKNLTQNLENVVSECEKKSYKHLVGERYLDEETARQDCITTKQKYVIKNFPVPNTREDIWELLHYIQPKTEFGFRADKNVFDWRNKYSEIINRAKSSYKSDKIVLDELIRLELNLKKSNPVGYFVCWFSTTSQIFKYFFTILAIMAVLLILLGIGN